MSFSHYRFLEKAIELSHLKKDKTMNKRYFFTLWALCILSTFAVIPFVQTVALFSGEPSLEFTPMVLVYMTLESIIVHGLILFFGLRFAEKIGIRFLLLEANVHYWDDLIKPSLFAGVGCASFMFIVDALLPSSSFTLSALAQSVAPLHGFLTAVFGVLNQEVILCLFGVSGIALLLKRVFENERSRSLIMVMSIVIAALLFGLFHLPVFLHAVATLGFPLIIRIMLLNLISGVTFGLIFWRKGFETAVLTHCIVDLIIYALMPLILHLQ